MNHVPTLLVLVLAAAAAAAAAAKTPDASVHATALELPSIDGLAGRPQHSLIGFLHSGSASAPVDELVKPLLPALWRSGDLTGEIQPRARTMDVRSIHVLSDVWRYPFQGAKPPFEDLTRWNRLVDRDARRFGANVLYDIWNEPSLGMYWVDWFAKGPAQRALAETAFFNVFESAHDTIRRVHGDQTKVIGPSLPAYNIEMMKRFMEACLHRGIKVHAIAWHEFPEDANGIKAIETHLLHARREFIDNPRYAAVGVKELLITEALSSQTWAEPAAFLAHLYHAEKGGAGGLVRACWDEKSSRRSTSNCWNNSLDGLLTSEGAPRPNYWAGVAYARSTRLRIASHSWDGIYAFASRDEQGRATWLLASINHQSVLVRLPEKIRVTVSRLDRSDRFASHPQPGATPFHGDTLAVAPGEVVLLSFDR